MIKTIYGVKDSKLDEFVQVVLLDESIYDTYWFNFANDITNPIYRRLNEFSIYNLADIDTTTGKLTPHNVFVCDLDMFLDKAKQNLVTIVQTLNYLPQGYFKMPKEMQDDIKEEIKECIKLYVEEFADIEQFKKQTPQVIH